MNTNEQHTSKGLTVTLTCENQEIQAGEDFSIQLNFTNTSDKGLIIPLFFSDKENTALIVGEEEAVGSTRTSLVVKNERNERIYFDNFGLLPYMPPPSFLALNPKEVFETDIRVDGNSTFSLNKEGTELLAGKDHCGLTEPGTYSFQVELHSTEEEEGVWSGKLESNEVSVTIK